MNIRQFGCAHYGDIEKAKCSRQCISKAEVTNIVGVCSQLRIRHVWTKDWYPEENGK